MANSKHVLVIKGRLKTYNINNDNNSDKIASVFVCVCVCLCVLKNVKKSPRSPEKLSKCVQEVRKMDSRLFFVSNGCEADSQKY